MGPYCLSDLLDQVFKILKTNSNTSLLFTACRYFNFLLLVLAHQEGKYEV